MSLTGAYRTNLKIWLKLADRDLINLALTDRELAGLVRDVNSELWIKKIEENFPGALKYKKKDNSYKNYYINLVRTKEGDIKNYYFLHSLKKFKDERLEYHRVKRIMIALHDKQYDVADYLFSLGYVPFVPDPVFSGGEDDYLWFWNHQLPFISNRITYDHLYNSITKGDVNAWKTILTTIYEEGWASLNNKHKTDQDRYREKLFIEIFDQRMIDTLVGLDLFDLVDRMVEDLNISPSSKAIDNMIGDHKSIQEIDYVVKTYNIEPDEGWLSASIDGYPEFFDYAPKLNPPLLPDQNFLSNTIQIIEYNYNIFKVFLKILSIMDEYDIEYVIEDESVQTNIFTTFNKESYGLNLGLMEDPEYKANEVWNWFLDKGFIPTSDTIVDQIRLKNVQLVFLFIHRFYNTTFKYLLRRSEEIYLSYLIDQRRKIDVSQVVRALNGHHLKLPVINWLDYLVEFYDNLDGTEEDYQNLIDILMKEQVTYLAGKFAYKFGFRKIDPDYYYTDLWDTNTIIDDITKNKYREGTSKRSFYIYDKLNYLFGNCDHRAETPHSQITEDQLEKLVIALIRQGSIILARRIIDQFDVKINDPIYDIGIDSIYLIDIKMNLFNIVPVVDEEFRESGYSEEYINALRDAIPDLIETEQ